MVNDFKADLTRDPCLWILRGGSASDCIGSDVDDGVVFNKSGSLFTGRAGKLAINGKLLFMIFTFTTYAVRKDCWGTDLQKV